ncbi:hypothetical protein [Mesorhizobium sp.]|uniref:hypothetical protein n=1 Tax=Mesorhizobium sp. TaxID=1871066 RepID=UPI000FE92263|nr:hypothetical protein [Mesorhizobium sp.]RWO29610.1 MAG: hypothetical protein EOS10_22475 [Mesorhizobium sp.]RWP64881.1 MAG: hypothetical protein EOR08_08175 [Mesorhizobium sp.]RWQ56533.1 MAG: hypothetical protein EOS82_03285 [Mesorhizobium sp.]TIL30003.1 MAG: hypothetical protein E5Y85_25575 [Mesorhizobium sp.]
MSEFTTRWQLRLLAAQHDLVDACGGIARVMEKTGYSKGQVGRWNGGIDRDLMSLGVVLTLEEDCGRPFVTAVMAEFHGRTLTDASDNGSRVAHLEEQVAGLVEQAGRLVVETVKARADGIVTPNEATILRGISSKISGLTASIDDALAGVQAAGGLKVVGGE